MPLYFVEGRFEERIWNFSKEIHLVSIWTRLKILPRKNLPNFLQIAKNKPGNADDVIVIELHRLQKGNTATILDWKQRSFK